MSRLFLKYGELLSDANFTDESTEHTDYFWRDQEMYDRVMATYHATDNKIFNEKNLKPDPASCSFCNSIHLTTELFRSKNGANGTRLFLCRTCGWWLVKHRYKHYESYVHAVHEGLMCRESTVATFDVGCEESPYEKVKAAIALDTEKLIALNPRHAEHLALDILRSQLNCELQLTRKSKDGGYDILGFDSDVGKFLVEVKRNGRNVGVKVIREFLGVLYREEASAGIVVSVASGFTGDAKRERNAHSLKGRRHLMPLTFLDIRDVCQFLGKIAENYRSHEASEAAVKERLTAIQEVLPPTWLN